MSTRLSVAMTGILDTTLRRHLVRSDGQEDLCFATWRPSTGRYRRTALLIEPVLPARGERRVHGNAAFDMAFALRAAQLAAQRDEGIVFLHAHPAGVGWQRLNSTDRAAEGRIANLAREITGLPLVGMTLATGDGSWSARMWDLGRGRDVDCRPAESVRVVRDRLDITFNPHVRPEPSPEPSQTRTVHAWGDRMQANLARLRVLVAGSGSVGLHVIESLARTGVQHIGVMDFDRVEFSNLDRLHGASAVDAMLGQPKIEVARRVLGQASTAARPCHELTDLSVCEPAGLDYLLDFDIIFSCVDRPWPRHVLNTVAYADLIPVVDGGLRLDPLPGGGLRDATWRSHIVTAGRPCLVCIGQYDPSHVGMERDGSLDNPSYVAGLRPESRLHASENVSAVSIATASGLLNQFLSLVVAPSGMGDPGPLRYDLARHRIEPAEVQSCGDDCPYPASVCDGDRRVDPTGSHRAAERARAADSRVRRAVRRTAARIDAWLVASSSALARLAIQHPDRTL